RILDALAGADDLEPDRPGHVVLRLPGEAVEVEEVATGPQRQPRDDDRGLERPRPYRELANARGQREHELPLDRRDLHEHLDRLRRPERVEPELDLQRLVLEERARNGTVPVEQANPPEHELALRALRDADADGRIGHVREARLALREVARE